MAETNEDRQGDEQAGGTGSESPDPTRDNQEHELEAEEESAAAMDADVPQTPDSTATTEGPPS